MGNWWVVKGRNMLAGVPQDPLENGSQAGGTDHAPYLSDDIILEFYWTLPIAREAFHQIVPTMLPAEQERLYGLLASNPYLNTPYVQEYDFMQQMQSLSARSGIYTVGKWGSGIPWS